MFAVYLSLTNYNLQMHSNMPSMLSFEIGRSNVYDLVDLLHQEFLE
jgi:hypothetical protein